MSIGDQEKSLGNSDEISVQDLVKKVRGGIRYLKRKFLFIVAAGLIGGIIGFCYAVVKKPIYVATCSFVLEDPGKAAMLGQYAGLASMAGIDIGGSGSGVFQGDNILELYKSRSMIEKTLLCEANFNGHEQRLIDRYIEFNKLRKKWKDDAIANINFDGDPEKFDRKQDSVITDLTEFVNKKILSVTKADKKLNIIDVSVSSKDELFSQLFTTKIVETVNTFYIQTKIKKTSQSVAVLQHQADSIRAVLNKSLYGVASATDAIPNVNPLQSTLRVSSQKKQIDVQANTAIYAEIVKNLEMAKLSLRQETPLIQVIDKPVLPLYIEKVTKLAGTLIGIIAASLLFTLTIALRKLFSSY